MDSKKHQRKKSQGNIRSPLIKRDCQSQVTLRGWLHRLEGGALKQWKKRWFVLADYCLFYYKDSDEEKMLGSILLPSYTISPSTNDDKVSKKFAFKAEHQNMKTYYFAAESKESMCQWMNAMSLASIMQNDARLDLIHDHRNHNDEEDSGFTSYRSKRYLTGTDHNSTLNSSFASEQHSFHQQSSDGHGDNLSDTSQFHSDNSYLGSGDKYPGHCGGSSATHFYPSSSVHNHGLPCQSAQNSYANAPPKPRRGGQKDAHLIPPSHHYGSPNFRMDNNNLKHNDIYSSHHQRPHNAQNQMTSVNLPPRDHGNHPRQHPIMQNGHVSQPLDPRKVPTNYSYHGGYKSTGDMRHSYHAETNPLNCGSSLEALDSREGNDYTVREQPPRPHSADFLERSGSGEQHRNNKSGQSSYPSQTTETKKMRPKSSLERYDPHPHWNQDEYFRGRGANGDIMYGRSPRLSNCIQTHPANAFSAQHSGNVQSSHPANSQRVQAPGELHNHWSHDKDMAELQKFEQEVYRARKMADGALKKTLVKERRNRPYSTGYQMNELMNKPPDVTAGSDDPKKAQMREESMKRLLEWKQRMLQSPLTRKYSPRTTIQNQGSEDSSPGDPPARPPLPEEYRQKVLRDLENHEAQLRSRTVQYQDHGKTSEQGLLMECKDTEQPDLTQGSLLKMRDYATGADHSFRSRERSRSATRRDGEKTPRIEHRRSSSSLNRLNNSYSSDDEEESLKERRRSRRPSQAGRAKRGSIDRSPAGRRNSSGKRDTSTIPSSTPEYANLNPVKSKSGYSVPKDGREVSNSDRTAAHEEFWKKEKCRSPLPLKNVPLPNKEEEYVVCYQAASLDRHARIRSPLQGASLDDLTIEKKDSSYNMKREDYYLASRLFYPEKIETYPDRSELLRQIISSCTEENDAKTSEKPHCEVPYQEDLIEVCPPMKTQESTELTYDSHYRQNLSSWEIDKDVGLPLPPYPNSGRRRNMRLERNQGRGSCMNMGSPSGKIQDDSDTNPTMWQLPPRGGTKEDHVVHQRDSYFERHSRGVNDVLMSDSISSLPSTSNENTENPVHSKSGETPGFTDNKDSVGQSKNCSFEEMRLWLQQQKEVPPPNIVQERIKHFEEGSNKDDVSLKTLLSLDQGEKKKCEKVRGSTLLSLDKKKKALGACIQEKDGHSKFFVHRRLHSDSETVIPGENRDADSTEDDVTSKSAPITLSPLSSVLADLRRTADTRKERRKVEKDSSSVDEVIVTKGALRLSLAENRENSNKQRENSPECVIVHVKGRCEIPPPDEEAYLPMTGKATLSEPEYVAMENSASGQSHSPLNQPHVSYFAFSFEALQPSSNFEEPVYDEPMSPPHSFLHDVYERHKTKPSSPEIGSKHNLEESLDDSCAEENVYETPDCPHKTPVKMSSDEPLEQGTETSDNAYEELYKVSGMANLCLSSLSQSDDAVSQDKEEINLIQTPSISTTYPKSALHSEKLGKYSESSIPDLLHHKEIKDSEASDADDEASRDFEMHKSSDHLRYQSPFLSSDKASSSSFKSSLDDNHLQSVTQIYERRESFLRSVVENTTSFGDTQLPQKPSSMSSNICAKEASSDSDSLTSRHTTKEASGEVLLKSISPKEQVSVRSKYAVHHMRICSEAREKVDFKSLPFIKSGELPRSPTVKPDSSVSSQEVPKTFTSPTLSSDNVIYNAHSYFGGEAEPERQSHTYDAILASPLQHKHSFSDSVQNPLLQNSPTPDVVPNEAVISKEELNLSRRWLLKKTRRSPNSAPYYYSDLLPDNEEDAAAGLTASERHVSPRSNLLNNVRDLSPSHSSKGDIGRKVNKINEHTPLNSMNNRMFMDDGARSQPYFGHDDAASKDFALDLKSSLEQLLGTDSKKFLDTERNKYEAGHTLQKTRQTLLSMAGLKQRSSTPDLGDNSQSRISEPAYENIGVRLNSPSMLPRRLSRSLEGLANTPEQATPLMFSSSQTTSGTLQDNEPYYENVQFVKQKHVDMEMDTEEEHTYETAFFIPSPEKTEKVASPQACPAKHSVFDYSQIPTLHDPLCDHPNSPVLMGSSEFQAQDRESDSEYLDRQMLRRESERHFWGKTGHHYHSPQHFSKSSSDSGLASYNFLAVGRQTNFDGGGGIFYSMDNGLRFKESSVKSGMISERTSLLHSVDRRGRQRIFSPSEDVSDSFSADSLDDLPKLTEESVLGFPKGRIGCSKSLGNISSFEDQSSFEQDPIILPKVKDVLHVSDSEIHVPPPQMLNYLMKNADGLNSSNKRLSISAGDLLGKTHEELVLLLIQLRRSYAKLNKSRHRVQMQLENEHFDPSLPEDQRETENHLKQQLQELDEQCGLIQPLINLVDNMVKLGSLYGMSEKRLPPADTSVECKTFEHYYPSEDMLEFFHKIQESHLVTKDNEEWEKPTPSEENLEEQLRHLYFLDHVLQEESSTLASLQQDKEILEKTLEGVKGKISQQHDNPVDMEKLRKQQHLIEKELSRVRTLLTQSAKHLEETAAENAKMEHEVVVLQQKIEQALKILDKKEEAKLTRTNLENELPKIQKVLDDLSNRRREISTAVENLKAEARIGSTTSSRLGVRASPTGVAGGAPLPGRKKLHCTYQETDLDTMETRDLALVPKYQLAKDLYNAPLYANVEKLDGDDSGTGKVDTDDVSQIYSSLNPAESFDEDDKQQTGVSENYSLQDINDADDRMKRYYGIVPRDKPAEIKTVRIVKRESERRNKSKDKKKVSYDEKSLVWVLEEPEVTCYADDDEEEDTDADSKHGSSLPPGMKRAPLFFPQPQPSRSMSAHQRLFGSSPSSSASSFSPDVKPASNGSSSAASKKITKKSKRRHYTISGSHPALEQMSSRMAVDGLRARDDMDMERCLRTANTPDIVRSTIKKSEVYDEKIIERELGLPQKIVIPERYIDDEPEQLSAAERLQRSLKAETIRRMLSETATYEDIADKEEVPSEMLKKKLHEEKKQRAQLLALNHALAREVMERSKVVAASVTSLESPQSAS